MSTVLCVYVCVCVSVCGGNSVVCKISSTAGYFLLCFSADETDAGKLNTRHANTHGGDCMCERMMSSLLSRVKSSEEM